jgi:hypothetical protein
MSSGPAPRKLKILPYAVLSAAITRACAVLQIATPIKSTVALVGMGAGLGIEIFEVHCVRLGLSYEQNMPNIG